MSQGSVSVKILTPKMRYEQLLQETLLFPDAEQKRAIVLLDQFFLTLLNQHNGKPHGGFWERLKRYLFGQSSAQKSLYFYGGVGRGKSMLMDLFVECAKPHMAVKRVHFHAFMLDVHKRLHLFRRNSEEHGAMKQLIDDLAPEQRVLCLDEFEVHDVTDAAILAKLFGHLMQAGVQVIFTSNRAPQELYPNGLQRDQFLRFVNDILIPNAIIFPLNAKHDYRLQQLNSLDAIYKYPRNEESDLFLLESWKTLTRGVASEPLQVEVSGRQLIVEKHVGGIAWMTFNELCRRPLGASDYLALCQVVHTLLLQGIPALTPEDRNEARRFVTLIDALYDSRIKCLFTAETSPNEIYAAGDGNFEFARTASRLHEMQSVNYLAQTKRQS